MIPLAAFAFVILTAAICFAANTTNWGCVIGSAS